MRPALAVLVLLVASLAGCGGAGGASDGSSGRTTLTCSTVVGAAGVDVISARLTCHVSGAPASDTAFDLTYHVTSPGITPATLTPVCRGTLVNGVGVCQQMYNVVAPNPIAPASVAGETTPSHTALGPVTPTEIDATLAPGQHL